MLYTIEYKTVMNQKKQTRTDSPGNQRGQSSDTKRGIFTSNETKTFKPNVIPYLQQSLQGQNKYIQHLHPHRINQSLSFINSSYTNGSLPQPIHQSYLHEPTSHTPPKVHFIYPQGSVSQHNIPAYTTSQHYIDTRSQQQIQYIPIENNREKTQIRRTVVPVHITNQIPTKIVVNPPTPQYQPFGNNTHNQQSQNDEAYQILLKQYEKLYERLSKQQLYNQQLEKQITRLKQQPPPRIPTPKHTEPTPTIQVHHPEQKNIQIRRKYGINMKQLHDKLFKIYKKVVDDVISRKKQESQEELRGYFAGARKQVVVSSTQVVEHSTKVYRKN